MIIDYSRTPFVKAEIHPYADGELTAQNALFRRITVTRDNEVVVDGQIVTEEAIDGAIKWVEGLKEAFRIAQGTPQNETKIKFDQQQQDAIRLWFDDACYALKDIGHTPEEKDYLQNIEEIVWKTGATNFNLAEYFLRIEARLQCLEATEFPRLAASAGLVCK